MIDLCIILVYLAVTLKVGINASKGVDTMRKFSIYSNIPTVVLLSTMSATIIDSSYAMGLTQEIFDTGLLFVLVCFSLPIGYLVVAKFFVPRMKPLIHHGFISVGDLMEHFYGRKARIITGFCATALHVGYLGTQVCALGYFCHYFVGLPHMVGILLGAGVVIFYSVFGGIRSVTITDIIQFGMLMVVIPIAGSVSLQTIGGWSSLIEKIPEIKLSLTPAEGKSIWTYISIAIIYGIPDIDPPFVQRLLMARDTKQMQDSVYLSALVIAILLLCLSLIGFTVISINPNLDTNMAMLYFIDHLLPVGLRGLAVAGMLAIIMSTADSCLNAGSVCFVHDFLAPLMKKKLSDKKELILARATTVVIGLFSVLCSLVSSNILEIMLIFCNFWIPIVLVPLAAGAYGVKSNSKAFLSAATAGAVTTSAWMLFDQSMGFDGLVPALVANAVVFFTVTYFTNPKNPKEDPKVFVAYE